MEVVNEKLIEKAGEFAKKLFPVALDIFDNPEIGGEEEYASNLLCNLLEEVGFSVERGIAGLPTAFRAEKTKGEGGPTIGFLAEYDALRGMGHACGHHLQAPVGIAAALALFEACDAPFSVVIYGTPDEEINGGKTIMEKNGCFGDVDVMFAWHAAGKTSVSAGSKALASTLVTFHGTPSHASGSPEKGRSALDAMMLAFHGLEIMREHVRDGSRISYTVLEGTGATNIVHQTAKARITLRFSDRKYVEEMRERMKKVIDGACMMTETKADIKPLDAYWNVVCVESLTKEIIGAARDINAEKLVEETVASSGSTDVGNVSWVVPTAYFHTYLCNAGAHTEEFMAAGRSEAACDAIKSGAKIIALVAEKIIKDKELLARIKEEHKLATIE